MSELEEINYKKNKVELLKNRIELLNNEIKLLNIKINLLNKDINELILLNDNNNNKENNNKYIINLNDFNNIIMNKDRILLLHNKKNNEITTKNIKKILKRYYDTTQDKKILEIDFNIHLNIIKEYIKYFKTDPQHHILYYLDDDKTIGYFIGHIVHCLKNGEYFPKKNIEIFKNYINSDEYLNLFK